MTHQHAIIGSTKTIPTILLFCLGLVSCGKTSNAGSCPLTACVVSGEKLDRMGEPHVFTHEGTEVRL
jgi:hypothetical protein